MVRRIESSIACHDRWSSKAQLIQRCKSGHASSLAVWIESKSSSVGGRKIRRGVTMGIKWRIERLRWNCSGLVKTKNGTARTHCSAHSESEGLNCQLVMYLDNAQNAHDRGFESNRLV